jgi:von Willebrand factor type A domain
MRWGEEPKGDPGQGAGFQLQGEPMNNPTEVKRILMGLLIDVSGSMASSIRNAKTSQNRLESFRDALESLVGDYAAAIEQGSKSNARRVEIFAYGFGFGNPLAQIFGRTGLAVRDLLLLGKKASSTLDIVELAKDWTQYKVHIEGLAVEMFGSTPMGAGFQTVRDRFKSESARGACEKILFVLSDGEPIDFTAAEIEGMAQELKDSGILIVSCYVMSEDLAEPRHIYGDAPSDWSAGAKLMFNCASVVPKDSPFYFYLKEYGWKVDEAGRLFTQVNQSELLAEFMNVVLSPLKDEPQRRTAPAPAKRAVPPKEVANATMSAETHPKEADHPPGGMPSRAASITAGVNWPAWIFGGLLIVFFMGIVWFRPQTKFDELQQKLVKILAAVCVGVVSAFFTGALRLEGKVPMVKDVQVGALGGFAGFVLTYFLW